MNGTLASIHDIEINYLLSHRDFGGADSSDYWIGLNSLSKRGEYKWTDGTPLQFTNFTNKSLDGGPVPADPLEQG